MSILTIEQTLIKDGSDFKDWLQHPDVKVIWNECPQCGSDIVCAYGDMASVYYCDTYHHICMNSGCNYIEKEDKWGAGMSGRELYGPSNCPFCSRKVY